MDLPVTFNYAKVRRRWRWKRALAIVLVLATAGWLTFRYGPAGALWTRRTIATWRVHRAFDAAAAELFPDGQAIFLPTPDGPDAAAHLARLIRARDSAIPGSGVRKRPWRVHLVRTGTVDSTRWIEFGGDDGSMICVFRVVRADPLKAVLQGLWRVAPEVPADYAGHVGNVGFLPEPATVHAGSPEGNELTTALRTADTTNRLRWSWANDPSAQATLTPLDGWAVGNTWWPQRAGMPLLQIGPPSRTLKPADRWEDLAFAPDGRLILAGAGKLGWMDPATGQLQTQAVAVLDKSVGHILSPAGAWCYAWAPNPEGGARAIVVSTADGRTIQALGGGDSPKVYFDGPRILMTKMGNVWRTDLETGQTVGVPDVRQFPLDALEGAAGRPALPAGSYEVLSVSPNERWVAGVFQSLSLYDWPAGRRIWGVGGTYRRERMMVRWSDDGTMGSVGDSEGICVWRLGEGAWIARWPKQPMSSFRVAISGDGRRLAALAQREELFIWDDLKSSIRPPGTAPAGTPAAAGE